MRPKFITNEERDEVPRKECVGHYFWEADPQPTEKYSVSELKKLGMVGIYENRLGYLMRMLKSLFFVLSLTVHNWCERHYFYDALFKK